MLVCLFAFGADRAGAKTPDGQPPSVETVCDNEHGAAFGLCNAFCEAMDCDSPNHHASDQACASVKRNFERKTGRPMPCLLTCPCPGLLSLFDAIVDGTAEVASCTLDEAAIFVVTEEGTFATVMTGPPAQCNDNGQPPFVDLTETERLVCRVVLRTASEAQGVPCLAPE